jgi:hypothetical protein
MQLLHLPVDLGELQGRFSAYEIHHLGREVPEAQLGTPEASRIGSDFHPFTVNGHSGDPIGGMFQAVAFAAKIEHALGVLPQPRRLQLHDR